MTPIVDYLTHFEHIARMKIKDLVVEAEASSDGFLTQENRHLEAYRRFIKDHVRFRWIHHLSTVKAGPLSTHEFSIGLSSFEVLYPPAEL